MRVENTAHAGRHIKVFISHSSKDQAAARELYRFVKTNGWMDVWFIEANLKASQNWDREIRAAVMRSDVLVLLFSRESSKREEYIYPDPIFVFDIYRSSPGRDVLIVPLRLERSGVPVELGLNGALDYFPKTRQSAVNLELMEKLKTYARQNGFSTERFANDSEPGQGFVWSPTRWKGQGFTPDYDGIEEGVRESKPIRLPSKWKIRFSSGLTRALYFMLTVLVLFVLMALGLAVNFVNTGQTVNSVAEPIILGILTFAPQPTPTLGIGSVQVSPIDGMRMVYVPAGEFLMGSDDYEDDEKPAHKVLLDAFWVDQYELTNEMYGICVEEGVCGVPTPDEFYNVRQEFFHRLFFDELAENQAFASWPVTNINWDDADTYCRWVGRRLPTEAEWEKAARGLDGRTYPWGEEVDCGKANFFSCFGYPAHVGSYEEGTSPYGAYDMAGNAIEWVADWYGRTYYQVSPYKNPLGPTSGSYRVFRGGGWGNDEIAGRTTNRPGIYAYLPAKYIGFRCAVSGDIPVAPTAITPASYIVTQTSSVDGMQMVHIPVGEFIMGSDYSEKDEWPAHKVFLDSYWIDRYEVTNQQYAICVKNNGCNPPYSYFVTDDHFSDPEYANHPVTGVSWNDAFAYCGWAGRRLPSEAEWEKAARGERGMRYPWGERKPSLQLLNFNHILGETAPVGYYAEGASPYGIYDMAGNVWEWVNDWYDDNYYPASPGENPFGPETGTLKILRGGSWGNDGDTVQSSNRFAPLAMQNLPLYIGFRCGIDASE